MKKKLDIAVCEQMRKFAQSFIDDPIFQMKFRVRWQEGNVPPSTVEMMFYFAAGGRPAERVVVTDSRSDGRVKKLDEMTQDELDDYAERAARRFIETRESKKTKDEPVH